MEQRQSIWMSLHADRQLVTEFAFQFSVYNSFVSLLFIVYEVFGDARRYKPKNKISISKINNYPASSFARGLCVLHFSYLLP